jgi:tetratricopeptide (TPR) repeat protein
MGRLGDAIEAYDRVLALSPDLAPAYYNRGTAFLRGEDFERAVEDLTHALALDPSLRQAYLNRAEAWAALGDSARAEADRRRASEIEGSGDARTR